MKNIRWIVAVAMGATAWANSVDLSGPQGVLGYADSRGRAQYEINYQSVDAGDGVKLPFRYIFNSSPKAGMGWDVPLLTARAIEYDPITRYGYFEVRLICGKKLFFQFLYQSGSGGGSNGVGSRWLSSNKAISQDGQWLAEVTGFATSAGNPDLNSSAHNFTLTVTRWDGWKLHFDNGPLQTLTSDTGKVLNWNRNGAGKVTSITVAATNQTILSATYSGANLTGITVNGDLYTPQTNINGQLEQVQRPDGTLDAFAYTNFSSANLGSYGNTSNPSGGNANLEHTNRYGVKTKLSWEPLNHLIVSDGVWNYTVTKPGSWVVDSGGMITDERYGAPDIKRTRIATGEWEQIDFSGDRDSGRTIRYIDGSEARVTENKGIGPANGKTTKIEKKIGTDWVQTYYAAYDQSNGRLIRSTDAYNKDTVYTYTDHPSNVLPHPVASWTDSTKMAPPKTVTATDATGRAATYEYDPRGNLVKATDGAGIVQSYEYDSRDRLTKIKNNAGSTIAQYAYNNNDRVTSAKDASLHETTFEYLNRYGASLPTKVTSPSGLTATFTYDAKGNRISAKGADGETWTFTPDTNNLLQKVTDPLATHTDFTYDGRANLASITNALGKQTTFESDDLDLTKKITDPLTQPASFQNNGDGQIIKVTDKRAKVYDLEYQDRFRRTKLKFPGASQNVSAYSLTGRLSSWTNRAGTILSIARDDAGRVTGKSWSGGYGSSFTYDAAGRISHADATYPAATVHKVYTYDSEGRISTLTQDGRTTTFHYNADSRVSQIDYPAGFSVLYAYDLEGRLSTVTLGTTVLASYGYNTKGQLATLTTGNGLLTTYTYDQLNRVTTLTVTNGATAVSAFTYGYNALGNRTYATGLYSGSGGDAYQYDDLGQLTGVKYNTTTAANGYASATSPASTETTSYDAAGNRSARTVGANSTTYTANDLNQYTAVTAESPAYDGMGNLTSHGGWTLAYSPLGQLISATKTGSPTQTYGYDAFGNRAVEVSAGNYTRKLLYSGSQALESYEVAAGASTGTATSYVFGLGIDDPIAVVTGNGASVQYPIQDGLGSVVALTNSTGTVIERYTYDAWGTPKVYNASWTALTSAPQSRFLFTGRDYDAETGLYHYRSRAYSPKLGRFLQPDRIDLKGDLNVYRYCGNNPINLVDPFGYWSLNDCAEDFSNLGNIPLNIPEPNIPDDQPEDPGSNSGDGSNYHGNPNLHPHGNQSGGSVSPPPGGGTGSGVNDAYADFNTAFTTAMGIGIQFGAYINQTGFHPYIGYTVGTPGAYGHMQAVKGSISQGIGNPSISGGAILSGQYTPSNGLWGMGISSPGIGYGQTYTIW